MRPHTVETQCLFPRNSMAECPAVNRDVAGSSPAEGAKFHHCSSRFSALELRSAGVLCIPPPDSVGELMKAVAGN